MRGGDMSRAYRTGFIHEQPMPNDLLDLPEENVESEFGRGVEDRIAAENEERLDRALIDLVGQIADGGGINAWNKAGEISYALVAERLIDLRDKLLHLGRLL